MDKRTVFDAKSEIEIKTSSLDEKLFHDYSFIKNNHKKTRRSKLDPYKREILVLRQLNLSYEKISYWLNDYHGFSISPSNIMRRVEKWGKH